MSPEVMVPHSDTAVLPWAVEQPPVLPSLLLCSLRSSTNCLDLDSAAFKSRLQALGIQLPGSQLLTLGLRGHSGES